MSPTLISCFLGFINEKARLSSIFASFQSVDPNAVFAAETLIKEVAILTYFFFK